MKIFLWRWLTGWVMIADGLLRVLTMGLIYIPSLTLWTSKKLSKAKWDAKDENA